MGFTCDENGITYREWAPAARAASLIGDFNSWNTDKNWMKKNEFGVFELFLPNEADGSPAIPHGSRVKIHLQVRTLVPLCRLVRLLLHGCTPLTRIPRARRRLTGPGSTRSLRGSSSPCRRPARSPSTASITTRRLRTCTSSCILARPSRRCVLLCSLCERAQF